MKRNQHDNALSSDNKSKVFHLIRFGLFYQFEAPFPFSKYSGLSHYSIGQLESNILFAHYAKISRIRSISNAKKRANKQQQQNNEEH